MSAKKDGTSFSIEDDSYTEDVSRAWDSLQEAKHVLQRIENKMSPEVHRRKWMPKTQRLLFDRDSFSGHDSCFTTINDQLLLGDIKEHSRRADETFTLDRFPERDDTYDSSIEDIKLGCSGRNLSSKSSFFSERKVFPTDMDRRHIMAYSTKLDDQDWLPAKTHRTSGDISFLESNRPREYVVEDTLNTYLDEFSYPLTVQNLHSEEQNVPCVSAYHIMTTLSPKRDLYTQKLDYLKNKSPNDKLERLKEKIREQKRRRNASRERLPNAWQAGATIIKPLLKRKVCKVTFAPPPRNFKGISAQSKKTGRSIAEMREPRSRNRMETLPLGKPQNAIKKSPVFRKLSFESPSPEKKARSTDLYGASAWREGQKLVKKLLGPSPVVSKMLRVSQEDGGATMRAGSCKSISQKTLLPSDAPVSHLNTKTFTQACRKPGHCADVNLHSSTPEALQRISTEVPGMRVLDRGRGVDMPKSEAGILQHVARRSESTSPKRSLTDLVSLAQNPKKENVAQGDQKQGRKHKIRSYSVEEVRDFMKKKNMERLKREREAQSLLQNAAQLRQKRLQAVFKKQKDAFPFRSDPKARVKYHQRKHCETTCLGSEEKGIPEWVQLKSLALLKEVDQSSRKGTPHANKDPVQDEHSSPLKLQDLDTFSMTLKKQIAEISSKNDGIYDSSPPNRDPSLSPYRDNQDRMKAIWAVAKELGERIEVEASRLGTKQIPQDPSSNPVPIQHTSPAKVSPTGSPNNRISRFSPELSSIRHGKAAQPETERRRNLEKWRVSDSSLGTYTVSTTSRNDNLPQTSGHVGSDTMMEEVMDREYHINKGYRDRKRSPTNKRHQDKKTRKDSPNRQSSSTSPQVIPMKSEPSWHLEKITGTEFTSPKLDRKNSHSLKKVNKDKRKKISILSPAEEGLTGVHDLPQTKTDIVQTLKAQITQQKEELAILRVKAKAEAEEAERCMEEMMKHRAAWPVELAELEGKQTAQQTPKIRHVHSDNCLGGVAYAAPNERILIHDAVKDRRQNDKTYPVLQTDIVENEPVDDSWDQMEPATDSTSKWSEISEFYGTPNMFSRYSLEMAQQYLREEELRARHQTALLRLREEALKEKTRAELALLEHRRKCLELNNEHGNVEEILELEHKIQENLKQEQAEIRHLSNIYKAAHQERKLLLKQQKDVLRIQQLAAHMKKKLYSACATQQVPGDSKEQITDDTLCSSAVLSVLSNQDTDADLSDHLADDDDDFVEDRKQTDSGSIPLPDVSPAEDRNMHKETLPRHQDGAAEGYPSSGMEEPMMEAVENNLRKHHHKFPTAERKLCNHLQAGLAAVFPYFTLFIHTHYSFIYIRGNRL
ncbi:coiled-coil domain-containing protein 187 [Pelobates fuscus]|uniref:coiled-coil domain-containing protein 187 n=1 Tax=Pelobates fuscus TaxID=191477 RepID=UPI002FE4572C